MILKIIFNVQAKKLQDCLRKIEPWSYAEFKNLKILKKMTKEVGDNATFFIHLIEKWYV
jgi:hypothetical protein